MSRKNKGKSRMVKSWFALLLCMILVLEPVSVQAEEWEDVAGGKTDVSETDEIDPVGAGENIASGEDGGISWVIDGNGLLTISGTAQQFYDDVPGWNKYTEKIKSVKVTAKNVQSTREWFYGCSNLEYADFSEFDTSNVTNMREMFQWCEALTSLDLSYFDTSNVTDMSSMFYKCKALSNLDISRFDTGNVENMCFMFSGCELLSDLAVSSFDTSKVTDMKFMFYNCKVLKELDVSHFDTSKVTDMNGMFMECQSLESLDLSHFDTGNVTNMNSMFDDCQALASLDLSYFNTGNVADMSFMFYDCETLSSLNVSQFDTGNVTDMKFMFGDCKDLKELEINHFNTGNVTDMSGMFENCGALSDLDLSHFDTGNVTNMDEMFSGCETLSSLDLSHFDTGNVTNMHAMFHSCKALSSLDLSTFDTSNVTDMYDIFYSCDALSSLRTPKNLSLTVGLPATMYDSDGTPYDTLPMGRTDSILLTQKTASPIDPPPVDETEYKVTFDMQGHGTAMEAVTVKSGKTIPKPADPAEEGYTFGGWYKESACENIWDFDTDKVTAAITLYAKWTENVPVMYTVSFNLQGHGAEIAPTSVKSGEKLAAPDPEPSAKGYIFGGWFRDAACTTAWDFAADTVTADLVLYAKWTADRGTVTPTDIDDTYYAQETRQDLATLNCQISEIKPKVYDGKPYLPAVKVTATVDGRTVTLTEGVDYRVLYENNVNAGTGKVIVKGNGKYTGTAKPGEFRILPKAIGRVKVTAGGMGRNASTDDIPVCLYDGGYCLKKDKDFTFENIPADATANKGKFEVTVSAMPGGNYEGSRKVKITVYDKEKILLDGDVNVVKPAVDYNGKAQQCGVTVTYGGQPLEAKNYSVKYTNNKEAGTAYVTVTGKREYGGCVVKTFEIRSVSGEFDLKTQAKAVTYNGKLQKPKLAVTAADGKTLKQGRDYLLLYSNNLHAGKATATIRGLGNYREVKDTPVDFDILPQRIGKVSVKGTKEKLTVTYAKKPLKEGTDYTLEWGAEEKNKVSVTLKGKNDFTDTVVKKVRIK